MPGESDYNETTRTDARNIYAAQPSWLGFRRAGSPSKVVIIEPARKSTDLVQETIVHEVQHDANGHLFERIDPLQRAHIYEHDVLGRLRALEGPDGRRIELDYDAHDNLTKVVPPGRSAHQFRYTAADSAERYIPPALADVDSETVFHYDADLAPESAGPRSCQRRARPRW